jgi:HAD superfamily hydrolase (TIGR01509 family)
MSLFSKGNEELPAAILDVDGTLVDTNYHHAIAWYRAFRRHGIVLPIWRIHRSIGMGGDHLVPALCGEEVEREAGDDIRAAEKELYADLIDEVAPLPHAYDLVVELERRGQPVVLSSSAKQDEIEHYIQLLGVGDVVYGWTSSADVDATKPEPDLIEVAVEKSGRSHAVMLGDSTWDCEAAERAGVETVAVLTGGFSQEELYAAGAAVVFESIEELLDRLDGTPFGNAHAAAARR